MYNWYFEYLKQNETEKVLSKTGIVLRRWINPIIRMVAPLTCKYKLIVVKRTKLPKGRPIIFAPTHGFKDDILFTVVTIPVHAYLLFGNLGAFFNSFDGISAWLNGVVLVDRIDKKSRNASKEKMKRVLELGSNMIVFPEGTWNKTENLLVQKLFPGIYDMATAMRALVVPVATVLEGKHVYASMGGAFDITAYDRAEGLLELRDRMCTLRYEIMEQYCTCTREELLKGKTPEAYWHDYIEGLISEVKCYDRQVEDNAHFQEKGVYSTEEVFAPIRALEINRENAFLWRK